MIVYLEEAPMQQILMEQAAYLLHHAPEACGLPNCEDCGRAHEMRRILLEPFRTAVYGDCTWGKKAA